MPVFETEESAAARPLGQFLLVALSLLWAVIPGYGMIDLSTAIPPGDPKFREHWFLEGSWGLLVTALIMVPLLVAAVRTAHAVDVAKQQAVLVGCLVAGAAACGVGAFLLLPLGLGISTLVWWWPLRVASGSPRPAGRVARWWPLLLIGAGYLGLPALLFGADAFTVTTVGILVAVGALVSWLALSPATVGDTSTRTRRGQLALLVALAPAAAPWLAYAVSMASKSRDGLVYHGSGIDRVVAQATFPILIVALPLTAAAGWLPVRLAVWPAAAAGAGFGFFAVAYPDHLASPGSGWGTAALVWSVSLVLIAEMVVSPHIGLLKDADPGG